MPIFPEGKLIYRENNCEETIEKLISTIKIKHPKKD